MSELFLWLAIGLHVLVLLLLWLQRKAGLPATARDLSEAQEALVAVRVELPPRVLGERIFAWQDWDFVSSQAPLRVQRLFLQERKAVALSWLRQTRKRVGQLRDFHRRAVRENLRPSSAVGVRLAIDYVLFLLLCEILRIRIWRRGPFRAQRMAGYAASVADQLFYLPGRLLVGLDPVRLGRIKNDWLRRSTAP